MKYHLIFYMNLMFSALSDEERTVVLDRCMEPLLKLGEDGFSYAVQMSGLSLEYLAKLRPKQLDRLKNLLESSQCEFVGNGYAQIIQPLIPWEVNLKNQELGIQTYANILGIKPKLATVNEMVYSAGSAKSFFDNDYTGLIMEWNNSFKAHPEWDKTFQFFPQKLNLGQDDRVDLIWGDSILFQKFQRYVHGEINLDEYMNGLSRYKNHKGALCLYSSDAEVFDFRPRRYGKDENLPEGEWVRIRKLLEAIQLETAGFILPSDFINDYRGEENNLLKLESYWQPIVVKKQDKYNINRWALTGRDDFALNTKCHRLAKAYKDGDPTFEDWKKLCFLWSSDLRTHIEKNRWENSQTILHELEFKWLKKGVSISKDLCQNKDNKYLKSNKDRFIVLKTAQQTLKFDLRKGLALREWSVNNNQLLGTVPHGTFEDISLAADFYSCHSVIEPQGEHKITDLEVIESWINDESKDYIYIGMELKVSGCIFKKKYSINKKRNEFSVEQTIEISKRTKSLIRSSHFTILPGHWDQNTFYYKTAFGGNKPECFTFGKKPIDHTQNLNQLVSARHGFGVTDGELHIGDEKNYISFKHEPSEAAILPHLQYLPQKNGLYLLRLIYSAQELDETFKTSKKPQLIKHKILVRTGKN